MKIAYLMQMGEEVRWPPFNGPANHVRNIIHELRQRGHQVRLLFRLEGQIWITDDLNDFRPVTILQMERGVLHWLEKGVRRVQFELKLTYLGFFESLRFALACRQELTGFDLFYERYSWMTYGGLMAARTLSIPWIAEYNGDPLADLEVKGLSPRGLQKFISVKLMLAAFRQAATLVATGDGWKKNLIERWGYPPDRIVTVENGTELLTLLRREDLRVYSSSIKTGNPLRVIYLGGFYPWHGVDKLLGACSRAIQRGASLHLTLIGSGSGSQEASRLADELGLTPFVVFTGQLSAPQYATYLAGADIGVSPYCGWDEFSGLKLFDYKAAGLVCLASGRDGQPATLEHGKTGWILPPCDQEALADALVQFGGNRHLVQEIGKQARLEAETNHGWQHTVDKIEAVMDRAIKEISVGTKFRA